MQLGDLMTFKSGEVVTRLAQRSPLKTTSGDYRLYDMSVFASESGEAGRNDDPRYLDMAEGLAPMPVDSVVLAIIGGRMTLSKGVDPDGKPYILDSNFSWIQTDETRLDASYLVYWFNESAAAKRLIHAAVTGTTMPKLSLKSITEFEIDLPPIKVQQKIGRLYQMMRRRRQLIQRREQLFTELTLASLADATHKEKD
ncbi:restriction endonuclease subunit S [Weissella sp. MSCH1]|uniref:restriction endonuclease subunit S n=1 Tax=Weissella sp. MSCH1 TaxID=3383343 RepID=UPI003896CC41